MIAAHYDSLAAWHGYLDGLSWQPGQLDEASYSAFLRAASLGIAANEALKAVVTRLRASGGHLRLRKVENQLRRAYAFARANAHLERAEAVTNALNTWPARDCELINQIVTSGPGLYDLWESSVVRFDNSEPHTEEIIDTLFPDDPLICVGLSNTQFATRCRQKWRGQLAETQFVVSNPMTKRIGMTTDGRESERTLDNTGPRRFLVVECDFAEFDSSGRETEWTSLIRQWRAHGISVGDACAAILNHLSRRGPLVLVVHSGGKSLHGWFWCENYPDCVLRRFMNKAHQLGADLATWRNRSQFVRMPDGTRSNGQRQTSYFFNPEKING